MTDLIHEAQQFITHKRFCRVGPETPCDCGLGAFRERVRIYLATPPASDAPASGAGFVLVPVEPTETMVWAYKYCPYEGARDKWSAMLAAAPKAASEAAGLRDALEEARRQLQYLDGRWPTGTTPAIIARIDAALTHPAPSGASGGGEERS